jgi:hypothetical protein
VAVVTVQRTRPWRIEWFAGTPRSWRLFSEEPYASREDAERVVGGVEAHLRLVGDEDRFEFRVVNEDEKEATDG